MPGAEGESFGQLCPKLGGLETTVVGVGHARNGLELANEAIAIGFYWLWHAQTVRALPELLNDVGDSGMFFHPVVVDVVDGDVASPVKLSAFKRHDAIAAAIVVACDNQGRNFSGDFFGEGAAIGAQISGYTDTPLEGVEHTA